MIARREKVEVTAIDGRPGYGRVVGAASERDAKT